MNRFLKRKKLLFYRHRQPREDLKNNNFAVLTQLLIKSDVQKMFSVKILFIFVSSSLMLAHSVPAKNDQIVFQNDDDSSPDDDQILKKDDTVLTSRFSEDEEFYQDLENGNMYQGDIILLPEQRDLVKNTPRSDADDDIPTRTGLISEEYRWPKDAQGNVQMPYEIDPSSQYCKYNRKSESVIFELR